MFTGIIEELGAVSRLTEIPGGLRIAIAADTVTVGTQAGDSIAVNGVCLTALEPNAGGFSADVSPETLARTTLGDLSAGAKVNLERALLPTTRLSGHIVQGHVDGRGEFAGAVSEGGFYTVTIRFPVELSRYFVEKGSVAVEGISLTIASLRDGEFDIAVIPKTWEVTNLHALQPGDAVNLEVDVIAKYVDRMMQGR
ncbi:MAG: riboflavin synthase [Acidobacteria bacterium]|nr:riboflavin synthase [Acidobacteriota bacterium]